MLGAMGCGVGGYGCGKAPGEALELGLHQWHGFHHTTSHSPPSASIWKLRFLSFVPVSLIEHDPLCFCSQHPSFVFFVPSLDPFAMGQSYVFLTLICNSPEFAC